MLHPQGLSSIRTISRLRLCPSHIFSLPFSFYPPLCLCSNSHNSYTVRHCPHTVPTLHSPSVLIVSLQTSFISYSSALAHYFGTFYSHPANGNLYPASVIEWKTFLFYHSHQLYGKFSLNEQSNTANSWCIKDLN